MFLWWVKHEGRPTAKRLSICQESPLSYVEVFGCTNVVVVAKSRSLLSVVLIYLFNICGEELGEGPATILIYYFWC